MPKVGAKPAAMKDDGKKERVVLYDRYITNLDSEDDSLLIVPDKARGLMGWTTSQEEAADANLAEPLLTGPDGKKVWCLNNITNRPVYMSTVESLLQEILNRRWYFNFEPVIIGKTGLVLNGQHTLIALIFAEWHLNNGDKKDHWQSLWGKDEFGIEKLIGYGVDERPEVVNTMDTCKPRSLADVFYRSEYFRDMKSGDRRVASRIADNAIKFLWTRTGLTTDLYAPRRTHAEAVDFVNRHPTLLKFVRDIHGENKTNGIGKYIPAGYASGLYYLMAACKTDPEAYYGPETSSETSLALKMAAKARDFWIGLATGSMDFQGVRNALGALGETIGGGIGGSLAEKSAVICKAWIEFMKDELPIKEKALKLKYRTDDNGIRKLNEVPTVGGIDLGAPKVSPREDPDAEKEQGEGDPTPEEIAAQKAAIAEENLKVKQEGPKKKSKKK